MTGSDVSISGEILRIVQVTDTHILANPAERYLGVDTAVTLSAVVSAVLSLAPAPDCILATGDLVEDPMPEAYCRLLELLMPLRRPVYCLPGNHDDPAMLAEIMNEGSVSTPRLVTAGGWSLILLNTWEQDSAGGRLPGTELDFLQRALQQAADRHVLLCLHHPPVSIGSPWMDEMMLANPEELFSVIDAFSNVRGMIWGHNHQEFETQRRGVKMWGAPSTGIQYSPRATEHSVDDRPPGFRELELLADGRIETRVIRVS